LIQISDFIMWMIVFILHLALLNDTVTIAI